MQSRKEFSSKKIYKSEGRILYICDEPYCKASFTVPDRLQTHKQVLHCGERPFKCNHPGCDKTYRTDPHLKRHHLTSHEKYTAQEVVCEVEGCGNIFCNKYVLKQHIAKVHTFILIPSQEGDKIVKPYTAKHKCDIEKRHKCDVPGCDSAFKRPYRLKYHKLTFHGGKRPFKCEFTGCDRNYTSNSHLVRHRLVNHSPDNPEMVMICGVDGCGKVYSSKHNLKRHATLKHGDIPVARKGIKTRDIQGEEEKNVEGNESDIGTKEHYKCNEPGCHAVFTQFYGLNYNKLSLHFGKRQFKCVYEGCDRSYTNEAHLARHRIASHSPDRDPTKEAICGMEGCATICSNKYSLRKHIARNHTESPFSCTECDEKFKRKSRLHVHKAERHEAQSSYTCNKCPKKFIHYRLYTRHVRNHKTYQCDCEKTFDKWSKLSEHRRTGCAVQRQEHRCETCGKAFSLKQNLMLHCMLVHVPDDERNLCKCPYLNCNKSYKYKWNLKYHIKSGHEITSNRSTENKVDVVGENKPSEIEKTQIFKKVARKSNLIVKNRRKVKRS